jgi:hypothetical protein
VTYPTWLACSALSLPQGSPRIVSFAIDDADSPEAMERAQRVSERTRERKRRFDIANRERRNALNRARYAADPLYREKIKQRRRESFNALRAAQSLRARQVEKSERLKRA